MSISSISSIIKSYESFFKSKKLTPSEPQIKAMELLANISNKLLSNNKTSFFGFKSKKSYINGIYMWGEVGRGKTMLMDLFYENLKIEDKMRHHFQHFMKMVNSNLKDCSGVKDPLKKVAKQIAGKSRLICFDEFIVTDVADAMILGMLFTYLFAEGVTIICTSNVPPDRLYEDGLQRDKFLPAIAQIKSHMDIFNFNSGIDYRRLGGDGTHPFYWLDKEVKADMLEKYFLAHSVNGVLKKDEININNRKIKCVAKGGHIIWFSFKQICGPGRSAHDYMELADTYHTIILQGLPKMGESQDDTARRFIQLVDEWYDRGKCLLIYASVSLEEIYTGKLLKFEFKRTTSRLIEMQKLIPKA